MCGFLCTSVLLWRVSRSKTELCYNLFTYLHSTTCSLSIAILWLLVSSCTCSGRETLGIISDKIFYWLDALPVTQQAALKALMKIKELTQTIPSL